jgi:hypothetical protein
MAEKSAGTAFAGTDVLNVSFVFFCPETCLFGHDSILAIPTLPVISRKLPVDHRG